MEAGRASSSASHAGDGDVQDTCVVLKQCMLANDGSFGAWSIYETTPASKSNARFQGCAGPMVLRIFRVTSVTLLRLECNKDSQLKTI